MSMGALLQQVRTHLRNVVPLDADQCDIELLGQPRPSAGETYVGIRELRVRSLSREHLSEEYEIEVSIWRRLGAFPSDRQGDLALRDDPYLASVLTLDDLERAVIRNLHANYTDIMAAANETLETGDRFQLALYYTGRGPSEVVKSSSHHRQNGTRTSGIAWIGRRLIFTGMNRVQSTATMQ